MLQTLTEKMVERDNIDRNREASPMLPAKDAFVIDTTSINSDQLLSIATKLIEGNLLSN
jgi:cytidylate kinase